MAGRTTLTNSSLNSSIDALLKASSPPPHLCAMPLIQTPPFWKVCTSLEVASFFGYISAVRTTNSPLYSSSKMHHLPSVPCVMYTPPILACSVSLNLKAATFPYCTMCDTKSSQDSSMMHPWKLQRFLPTFVPCVQQTPPFCT